MSAPWLRYAVYGAILGALCGAPSAAAPSSRSQALSAAADGNQEVLGPVWFRDALIYHNAFDQPDVKASIRITEIAESPPDKTTPLAHGLFGSGIRIPNGGSPFVLTGAALSAHRPMTLSFWWSIARDMPETGSIALFQINAPHGGYVSAFMAGKGDWCALQQPAGVMQVYNFPGIQNVNGIYDFHIAARLALTAGVWHHTAVVFRRASDAQLYMDGKPVCDIPAIGGIFPDGAYSLSLGASTGSELWLDEVAVLDRAIDADMVADYYRGLKHLRDSSSE